MPEIRPFRGYRYDLGKVGPLSQVIAPPYDVVDDALQEWLAALSPYNAVRVERPTGVPAVEGEGPVDAYTRAARTFNGWLSDDVVQPDTARCFYVVEQEFEVDGVRHTRTGFLARVRLEPLGGGRIYAHEQTLAGPKADRLSLLRSTGFNFSPVFGLYPDDDGAALAKLKASVRGAPPVTAEDHLGVINRLWPVADQSVQSAVQGLLGPKPVFIADGHHRYETALKYEAEQTELGRADPGDDAAPHYVLMMLVGLSDPGLIVQPTHRMLGGLPPLTRTELQAKLAPDFRVLAEFADAAACWERVQLEESQAVLGFGTAADGHYFAAEFVNPARLAELAPGRSPEWRGLAVSVLHQLVIDTLLAPAPVTCAYGHQVEEVVAALASGAAQVGVLVPPVGVEHVEWLATQGETMPPKSTYFYPKQLTGLVFNSVKRD